MRFLLMSHIPSAAFDQLAPVFVNHGYQLVALGACLPQAVLLLDSHATHTHTQTSRAMGSQIISVKMTTMTIWTTFER